MRKRLSEHAKARNKERFGTSNKIIKDVLMYGYTVNEFLGPFHDYLNTVRNKGSNGVNVKVKNDILVVYNRRSQRAITTWRVPDRYMPVEKYLVKNVKNR